jgi:GTP cyclohydrolase I
MAKIYKLKPSQRQVEDAVRTLMASKGIHKHGAGVLTSRMLGCFRDNPATRHEFMSGLNI